MMARAVIPVLAAAMLILTGCAKPGNADRSAVGVASAQHPPAPRNGFANLDGARIAYQVYGDLDSGKTPLLVLHGSLMSAESMVPMVAPFFATRPVIAIDVRGHGRTGDVSGPLTYERMADDAAGVLRALGVKRADLFGYSMGATTALILAVRHPDLVGKQVIVSGVSERGGWVPAVQASFEKWSAQVFAGSPITTECN